VSEHPVEGFFTSSDFRQNVVTTRAGGGITIRHNSSGFLEINADAPYALRAIAIERARLAARVEALDAATNAIRDHFREVFK
jgi:hypothetical protein